MLRAVIPLCWGLTGLAEVDGVLPVWDKGGAAPKPPQFFVLSLDPPWAGLRGDRSTQRDLRQALDFSSLSCFVLCPTSPRVTIKSRGAPFWPVRGAGMGAEVLWAPQGAAPGSGRAQHPGQDLPGQSVGLPVLVLFLGTPRAALPVSMEEQSQVLLSKDLPGGQSLGLLWDSQDCQQRGLGCQQLSVCLSVCLTCPFVLWLGCFSENLLAFLKVHQELPHPPPQ